MAFDIVNKILKMIKNKNAAPKNGLEYNNLAPIDDIPKDSEYLNALMWAFEDEKVRNIAISGPYGSGKSSIIETLLKNNKSIKKRSISISMASFASEVRNPPQTDDSESGRTKDPNDNSSLRSEQVDMHMLEEGILKQLFYKVDYSKIPQSRYRKIHKINKVKVAFLLIYLILLSIITAFVFAHDKSGEFITKIWDAGAIFKLTKLTSLLAFTLIAFPTLIIIINLIPRALSSIHIKEIKLPANSSMETTQDADSIFNKNTDEIMYFFETTKYEYVFFEDIDRFNNIEIFVKLRELNTLINNYDKIKRKRRVRFIYAVKDDMFNCEDRTKFFDFIIPVIPAANATNVADEMIKMLKVEKSDKQHDISKEYIMDIAPFIPDMRTLLSINNEFIMYKMMLQKKQDLNLMDPMMRKSMLQYSISTEN